MPAATKNKFLVDLLVVLGVVLVLAFIFLIVYLETPKNTSLANLKIATSSAQKKTVEYNLNNSVTGQVISIDKLNRVVTIETLDQSKKTFTVKIPATVSLNRPGPISEADYKNNNLQTTAIKVNFESLQVGSVLNVLSTQDPKSNNVLTAVLIEVLV